MLPETVRIREVGPRDGFQNELETGSRTLTAGPVAWEPSARFTPEPAA